MRPGHPRAPPSGHPVLSPRAPPAPADCHSDGRFSQLKGWNQDSRRTGRRGPLSAPRPRVCGPGAGRVVWARGQTGTMARCAGSSRHDGPLCQVSSGPGPGERVANVSGGANDAADGPATERLPPQEPHPWSIGPVRTGPMEHWAGWPPGPRRGSAGRTLPAAVVRTASRSGGSRLSACTREPAPRRRRRRAGRGRRCNRRGSLCRRCHS